jgi:serine O-acetyltransferase
VKIPDKDAVEKTIKAIYDVLFPVGADISETDPEGLENALTGHLNTLFNGLVEKKANVIDKFLEKLPAIRKKLILDAEYICECDPAATHIVEVISIYPGFFALFCYRLANYLYKQSFPLLPRMITEYAHKNTGIDIHPGATIGSPISIDHGTGIVIGETAVIGNHVKIFQGVTLGALSVEKTEALKKRHPTIEDDVVLYAGCTILGGDTIIGRSSIIGGNVWLTESINPFSIVYHKSEIIIRERNKFKEPLNFII